MEIKRILHIITGLDTGGAEGMLARLVAAMDRSRYSNQVLSLQDAGEMGQVIEDCGVHVAGLGMSKGLPGPGDIIRLRRHILGTDPHILQGWMYHGNLAASMGAALSTPGRPVVWNVRQTLYDLNREKRMTRAVVRMGVRMSDRPARIIYNSNVSRNHHEKAGFAPIRGVVIPNGIATDRFRPDPDNRQKVLKELDLSAESFIIGHFARFHPMKEHELFLRAAAGLPAESVRLIMAGKGVVPDEPSLGQAVDRYGLGERCRLLGRRDDMPALMAACDLVVMSSSWGEAFPNVVAESMACEVPCVVTDIGDAAHLVATGGIVVPPGDVGALGQAMSRMLEMPAGDRAAMGREGRRIVEENYSMEKVTGIYEQLYGELA